MASLWKLPVVFLCENNLYAEMTPLHRSSGETDLCKRVASYGISAERIDGNSVLDVYNAVKSAVAQARAGNEPTFIEAMTYRTCGHYNLDPGLTYRSKAEVAKWERDSPIARFEAWLKKTKQANQADLSRLDTEAKEAVQAALDHALASPAPDDRDALSGVFV